MMELVLCIRVTVAILRRKLFERKEKNRRYFYNRQHNEL
jgi:hypothetical protein